MTEQEYTKVAKWNMDDAILKTVLFLKQSFCMKKEEWDLDGAYWTLRNVWSESECGFEPDERKECETKLKELERKRKEYLQDKTKKRNMFYLYLENFSRTLNHYMVKNQYYFRKDYEEDDGL